MDFVDHNKKLTITIAIPTRFGGESLIPVFESIRNSAGNLSYEFVVIADNKPISQAIAVKLETAGVRIIWNDESGSWVKKFNQFLDIVKTDILILTQDDVIFGKQAVEKMMKNFEEDHGLSIGCPNILPLPPKTFFESIMGTMLRLVNILAQSWNAGDNYLSASGRCMVFRLNKFQNFKIPANLINADMFVYLKNKSAGENFKLFNDATVYIRCPQHLREQIRPSSRYQYSKSELSKHFDLDISKEYNIPSNLLLKALYKEFVKHPVQLVLYVGVYFILRLKRQPQENALKSVWDIEASTKDLWG